MKKCHIFVKGFPFLLLVILGKQNPQKGINFKDEVRIGITIQEMKSFVKILNSMNIN